MSIKFLVWGGGCFGFWGEEEAPIFLMGAGIFLNTGDPVEIVGLPTEKVPEKCQFPLGEKGGRRRHKDGDHDLVHV